MPNCLRFRWALVLAATVCPAAGASSDTRMVTSVVRSDPRTGQLVRGVVVSSRAVQSRSVTPRVISSSTLAAPPDPVNLDEAIEQVSRETRLSVPLIHSVIQVESNYNAAAVSPKGALGLMQLVPATARRFGVSNVFNPVDNLKGGARYLRYLLELFHGNYPLALAAYNAGEGAVARYGGVPPFPETQSYLYQIQKRLEAAKRADEARKPAAAEEKSGYNRIRTVVGEDGKEYYVSR